METIRVVYLAGGCFWGTEHFLKQIHGVKSTQVGYANSDCINPTYEQVCTGKTNAVETVRVEYNAELISLPFIIRLYFQMIDPTSLNKQGGDTGTQYRTGIYYSHFADRDDIEETIHSLASQYDNPIVVEVEPLKNFYPAEEYHQDYLDKNPSGYCHVSPELFAMARKAKMEAKDEDAF